MSRKTQLTAFFGRMAELEAQLGGIAVGGLLVDHGLWHQAGEAVFPQMALARLIEFWRRDQGWTVEKLAQEADVELEELLVIERGIDALPRPRTIFQLAKLTQVPVERMMELAGLAVPTDSMTRIAAVRFAAQSESMDKLTPQEQAALQDIIQSLSDMHRGKAGP